MVFNATFNNISVTSWQSVLLVEKTGVPVVLSQVTEKLYHIMLYQVLLTWAEFKLTFCGKYKKIVFWVITLNLEFCQSN
jgi:hypothetical protein